jgi:hypothetical protein
VVTSAKAAPPNSLVLISDAQGGSVPQDFRREKGIVSTDTCVAVGCLAEMDGQTEMTIGPAGEVAPGADPVFDGMLATPSRNIVVSTIEWSKLLEASVPNLQTRLRVWINRAREPDKIIVGFE